MKVLKALQENKVSEACLLGTTGYGYNDLGRETLEAVYAAVFHTQDALVRPQIDVYKRQVSRWRIRSWQRGLSSGKWCV